jgi:hypothetical protein
MFYENGGKLIVPKIETLRERGVSLETERRYVRFNG